MLIEVEVSLEDLKKIMNLDGYDTERGMLQTSHCDHIRFSMMPTKIKDQPERSKREDDEDPVMKYLAPLCDTIIELR